MQAYQTIIEVRKLSIGFDDLLVLENLDMNIYRGEILGVIGTSGCGKSVLLRSLVGLLPLRSGRVSVVNSEGKDKSPCQGQRYQRCGVLFQDGALFSSLNVQQNIQVPMREHLDLPQWMMDELAALRIAMVGLPKDVAERFPSELSGGMRKRAGLARALALDPDILLLDEPTAGLDPISAANFDNLVAKLRQTLGISVFMVTHDLDSLYTVCDRVVVLGNRCVVVSGSLDFVQRYDDPWVHAYFHGRRGRRSAFCAGQD
ncbi:MAG: ATP-binding cassette domain-containing protein [Alphaproteobacteria bacterium]|nr:ATP-binding cassette domain-containing protein [Alphaproteobacteria bacterium]